jgi:hypothetical protein
MKIELKNFTIGQIVEGFQDNEENGVVGLNGNLNIRPAYQREFVYDTKQQVAVIDTILKGFPLNVMYWSKNEDGTYEVLDGQQRTLSFCKYVAGAFSRNNLAFHNLTDDIQNKFKNYQLHIYVCEGTTSEKLDWFKIINIAGEKLTEQELRNAVYTGTWLSDAKRYFSKSNCTAAKISDGLCAKSPIRQELLETAIKWISGGKINEYMSAHQHDTSATELWLYFQNVMSWVKTLFRIDGKVKYKEMKGVDWGILYNQYHEQVFDSQAICDEVAALMKDEEVENKKGIFTYVFDRQTKHLNLRAFRENEKRTKYEQQEGICPICGEHFEYEEMEGDHITAWVDGGKTTMENLQMLCKKCNHQKSNRY